MNQEPPATALDEHSSALQHREGPSVESSFADNRALVDFDCCLLVWGSDQSPQTAHPDLMPRHRKDYRRPTCARDYGAWSARAAALVAVMSCERSKPLADDFLQESARLQLATTPASAKLIERFSPVNEPLAVTQQWRVSTTDAWPVYAGLVRDALANRYDCSQEQPQRMVCSRSVSGDQLRLVLGSEAVERGSNVVIRLEGKPD